MDCGLRTVDCGLRTTRTNLQQRPFRPLDRFKKVLLYYKIEDINIDQCLCLAVLQKD